MGSTTMTIRIDESVKLDLDRLAGETRRSRSFLAAEGLADYVRRELAIVQGIREGFEDFEAGDVVPHDEAMDELDAAIEQAARKPA